MAGKRRDWGRIRQLASGRWQARYPSPDGRLLPAPDTFETRKKAAAWLADKQAEIARDDWIDPDAGKVTFGEYAARWIAERTLSETTRERYEGILRNHLEPFLGSRSMADFKPPVVRRWRHERLEQARVEQRSRRRTACCMRSLPRLPTIRSCVGIRAGSRARPTTRRPSAPC